jgi:hypothetical protein
MVQEWKTNIRKVLLSVKAQFIDWVETFTNKFFKSLHKIDSSKELIELKNGEV